jgi:hypothetical protein
LQQQVIRKRLVCCAVGGIPVSQIQIEQPVAIDVPDDVPAVLAALDALEAEDDPTDDDPTEDPSSEESHA